jgi:hypothetical protein
VAFKVSDLLETARSVPEANSRQVPRNQTVNAGADRGSSKTIKSVTWINFNQNQRLIVTTLLIFLDFIL